MATSRPVSAYDQSVIAADRVVGAYDQLVVAADPMVVAYDRSVMAADPLVGAYERSVVAADPLVVAYERSVMAADPVVVAYERSVTAADSVVVPSDRSVVGADLLVALYEARQVSPGGSAVGYAGGREAHASPRGAYNLEMTHPRPDALPSQRSEGARQDGRPWLVLAAAGSFAVALLHAVIIPVGAPAYRYFGAGDLAPLAEQGSAVPALITSFLVVLFAVWGAYALSGAGVIRRLPLLRVALVLIAAIYTLRGLAVIPELIALARGALAVPRMAVFSAVSLAIGLLYIAGLVSSRRRRAAGA